MLRPQDGHWMVMPGRALTVLSPTPSLGVVWPWSTHRDAGGRGTWGKLLPQSCISLGPASFSHVSPFSSFLLHSTPAPIQNQKF